MNATAHPIPEGVSLAVERALLGLALRAVSPRHEAVIGIAPSDCAPFCLRIGGGRIVVERELPAQAHLWMRCDARDLDLLMEGGGDLEAWLQEGRIRVAGEARWLTLLAECCAPPKSVLGVRFAAFSPGARDAGATSARSVA